MNAHNSGYDKCYASGYYGRVELLDLLWPNGISFRRRPTIDPDGCWTLPTSRADGYAVYGPRGRWWSGERYIHRIAWRASHPGDDIPEGSEIDHLCCTSNCFRPDHLECVTRENRRRRRPTVHAPRVPAEHRRPTGLCRNGHDWAHTAQLTTQDNWTCVECGRDAVRRHDAKRRPKGSRIVI